MTKKEGGEERVYLANTSALLFITTRNQDRISKRARYWRLEKRERERYSFCKRILTKMGDEEKAKRKSLA